MQKELEAGLRSRWGVPIGLIDREHAVRRQGVLDAIAVQAKDSGGEHIATGQPGRVRPRGSRHAGLDDVAGQP
ncbi:hypothetical protein SK571_40365 [Lentzea sp. BCCO 10_0798]|uniref:Uncharacterized protein n=1 Tax=Lentzea kristufekii TaxID=3095430 RepID=A0ABU4U510_9PSEU|nr:hypothetical protein [Lentzea sp. BCCO 10_0798]MDX8055668.1 hypothetical protein [Lentzea sp. BCCO 10_0798]